MDAFGLPLSFGKPQLHSRNQPPPHPPAASDSSTDPSASSGPRARGAAPSARGSRGIVGGGRRSRAAGRFQGSIHSPGQLELPSADAWEGKRAFTSRPEGKGYREADQGGRRGASQGGARGARGRGGQNTRGRDNGWGARAANTSIALPTSDRKDESRLAGQLAEDEDENEDEGALLDQDQNEDRRRGTDRATLTGTDTDIVGARPPESQLSDHNAEVHAAGRANTSLPPSASLPPRPDFSPNDPSTDGSIPIATLHSLQTRPVQPPFAPGDHAPGRKQARTYRSEFERAEEEGYWKDSFVEDPWAALRDKVRA